MSSSAEENTIFLDDTPNKIKKKVIKYAFSDGRDTVEEHREKGSDCDKNISYRYLTSFMDGDVRLEEIRAAYAGGEMISGEIKKCLIDLLQPLVSDHQRKHALVDETVLKTFSSLRPLNI
eukprot:Plantae.Rhodophyta-Palmaria_palmata.ctg3600.p1 GENE.Plantae.Rhodophyta-Palmaria_palmata.ctg3600~~Plantae.Rhodophyta-Palmaria_palmata.ctg3600.p1  ORF type:complete len:120 (-),score=25.89 Plantae.Rhodophyta-Palmaria_palmata.ctg3600:125-484(-)